MLRSIAYTKLPVNKIYRKNNKKGVDNIGCVIYTYRINNMRNAPRGGEEMLSYVFPESITAERLAVAKRFADFCINAPWPDVLQADTVVKTLETRANVKDEETTTGA